tara:strand:+ start:6695 stop:7402 length:708 start_codon:yes stop_codon:yes gene_type:complete
MKINLDLTIITITYNNEVELIKTYNSIENLIIENGVKHIIINGGNKLKNDSRFKSHLIQEKDNGIYEALNKGVKNVKTKNLIFIHSGDILYDSKILIELIKIKEKKSLDLLTSITRIGINSNYFRYHSSKFWRPWMLKFHCQPPHLATIYSKKLFCDFHFNEKYSIISDFYMFKYFFSKKIKWMSIPNLLIIQLENGKSSNFLNVTLEFAKSEGYIKAFLIFPIRIILKIILSIK